MNTKQIWPLLIIALLSAGCAEPVRDPRPVVATTTSYLECAIRDVAGDRFRVARLLPPGSCPGYFDVSPAMLDSLAGAQLLLRFEFQSALDDKLRHFQNKGLSVGSVSSPEGLCLPATYTEVCRQVASELAAIDPENAAKYEEQVARIERRMNALLSDARSKIESHGLSGAKVLASAHQDHFCRAIGLDVVAVFTGREAAGFREFEESIRAGEGAGIQFVVANLQEGVQFPRPLAQRMKAQVVVFSNFPSMEGEEATFDALIDANLTALIEAARSE